MNCKGHGRALFLLLAILALSTIMDGLDTFIVSVALPTISEEMAVSISDTSKIRLTYVIAVASLLLPMAKLAKNGTVKRMLFWGIVIFTASSAACGISHSFGTLVAFRLVQGIGAALMTAAVPVLLADFLPADKKGLGLGVLATASGISVILGPTIGGIVISALDWRWIFLVNIPFGIISAVLVRRALPKDEGYDRSRNPDLLNSIFAILCIALAMICIQNIVGPSVPYAAVVACGAVSIASIAAIAYRTSKHPESALLSTRMLRRRDFQLLTLAFTMTSMIILGSQYVLPYFLQICGEFSVAESGLLLSVASVFAVLLSVPIGRWCDVHGCKLASVMAGLGRLGFSAIFIIVVPPGDFLLLLVGLAIMGCSMAFAGTGLSTALIHHADKKDQADAATFMMVVNYTAATLGTVLYFEILQASIGSATAASASKEAIESGFDAAMMLGCILAAVAVICALAVKNIIPKEDEEQEAPL